MIASVTRDSLFAGAVTMLQPARGYRVNIDALLLAGFAAQRRVQRLVDLGAGVGAVALAVNHLAGVRNTVLIEREAELADLARQNLEQNGIVGTAIVLNLGVSRLRRDLVGSADLVVSNPPFHDPDAARASADPHARTARFGTLGPFVRTAAALLSGPRARACFCYPGRALALLFSEASAAKLVAKRIRFVHSTSEAPARLALIELRRARPGGLVVEPPLVEWSSPGVRSSELTALLARPAAVRNRV